jgi:hypothetical protein
MIKMFKTYFKEIHENLRGSGSGLAGVVRVQASTFGRLRCCHNHGNESLAHEATTLAGEMPRLDEGGQ